MIKPMRALCFLIPAIIGMSHVAIADDSKEQKAFAVVKVTAEKGDVKSESFLGNLYHYGLGVPKDDTEAVNWWRKASLQGDVDASCELGIGFGHVPQITKGDAEEAEKFCNYNQQIDHLAAAGMKDLPKKRLSIIQSFTVDEFLKLPDAAQVMYVSGLLDGMSFVSYNYEPDQDKYSEWAHCAAQKSLGDTTTEVIAFIKTEKEPIESVGFALARTIGKRCNK